jgi:plastocyanin/mono/diheme cytochrome c family protein
MNTSKQINIMVALLFLSILMTGFYTIWDPSRAERAEEVQLEHIIERGAYIYAQNCRICHGDAGEGGLASNRMQEAPPLNRDDLRGIDPETGEVSETMRDQMYRLTFDTIDCGRVGRAMPTWGQEHGGTMNNEQLRQLTLLITRGTEEQWQEAAEFGLHEDEALGLVLEASVGPDDTAIPLNEVGDLAQGMRLQIGQELMFVEETDLEANTVTVERGLGRTQAAAHEAGEEVLTAPVPPDPPAIVERACGQIAGPAVEPPPDEPPSTELEITSRGIQFDKDTLRGIAGEVLTLTHIHDDAGQIHNVEFFDGDGPEAPLIAGTELEVGPTVQTLEFGPLDPGEYFYFCRVHPNMAGFLIVTPPGENGNGDEPANGNGNANGGEGT